MHLLLCNSRPRSCPSNLCNPGGHISHNAMGFISCCYFTGLLLWKWITKLLEPIFHGTCIIISPFGRHSYHYQILMFSESLRACLWAFRREPLTRLTNNRRIWFDAFDLLFNYRGIGWTWPQGVQIPKETRNVKSTKLFLLTTLQWVILGLIVADFSHYTVQVMLFQSNGSLIGSIFDPSLPPLLRYTRSTIITILNGIAVFFGLENQYYITTFIAVGLFQQSPTLWPPLSERPYRATSLNKFWTTCWHQCFREIFIGFGGKPFAYVFGKAGGVMGAFLISGILHDLGCWGLGRGTDPLRITGFFLMNGVGLILEHVYKSVTGKRVGGVVGLIWTYIWVVAWGSILFDAWFEHGLGTNRYWPTQSSPAFWAHSMLFR